MFLDNICIDCVYSPGGGGSCSCHTAVRCVFGTDRRGPEEVQREHILIPSVNCGQESISHGASAK